MDPAYLSVFGGVLIDDLGRLYNPSNSDGRYYLTTQDGFQYTIDAKTGMYTEIRDPLNQSLKFTDTSATTYDAKGNKLAEVTFRKEGNRIVEIFDPSGESIKYDYDLLTGDLISVTDRSDRTTSYEYNVVDGVGGDVSIGRPHFLTRIIDDRGVRVLQAKFDGLGRLSALEDASGGSAGFTYNVDGTTVGLPSGYVVERVTDASNDPGTPQDESVPTEMVRDDRGRIVRRITQFAGIGTPAVTDDQFQVVIVMYDASDRQIGQTQPFVVNLGEAAVVPNDRFLKRPPNMTAAQLTADPEDTVNFVASFWQSVQKFDDRGNVVIRVDSAGNRTNFANTMHLVTPA